MRSSFGSFGSSIACRSASSAAIRASAPARSSAANSFIAGIARELVGGGEVVLGALQLAEAGDDGVDLGVLAGERAVAVHVARRVLGGEHGLELVAAARRAVRA